VAGVDPELLRRHIEEGLRRLATQNRVQFTDKQMRLLPYWIPHLIPPHIFRDGCGEGLLADNEVFACACTGHCQVWYPADTRGVRVISEIAKRLGE
jgi:hypothetical protein